MLSSLYQWECPTCTRCYPIGSTPPFIRGTCKHDVCKDCISKQRRRWADGSPSMMGCPISQCIGVFVVVGGATQRREEKYLGTIDLCDDDDDDDEGGFDVDGAGDKTTSEAIKTEDPSDGITQHKSPMVKEELYSESVKKEGLVPEILPSSNVDIKCNADTDDEDGSSLAKEGQELTCISVKAEVPAPAVSPSNSNASVDDENNVVRSVDNGEENEVRGEEGVGINCGTVISASVDPLVNEYHSSAFASTATIPRRSQQIIQRKATNYYDSEDDSRFSTQSDADNEEQIEQAEVRNIHDAPDASIINDTRARKHARETSDKTLSAPTLLSSEEDGTQSRHGIQLSVCVNGRTYSKETIDDLDEHDLALHEDEKRWLDAISKDGISVYRVRTFQSISKCKIADKFGRKCSFWCIKNGYTASSARMLITLPPEIQQNGEACRDYVRSVDHERLLQTCRSCKPFSEADAVPYAHTYRYFIEMKPGDIVVMQVKGKKGGTPHPNLVFGVIQDDSLILMKKHEARNEHGFPYDLNYSGLDNGIMLRKVKWYRQGILQEVRGLVQADWLVEAATKWLAKVKGENLMKAIQKMGSKGFIENTVKIEEEWIVQGFTGR